MMETYYRKRTKKGLQRTNPVTEMECCQKEVEQDDINDTGKDTNLSRQHLVPPPAAPDHCALQLIGDEDQMQSDIQVGGLYEIDHIHLPPRTPIQLRSIRVAMVCEKTKLNVAVRFPSMESLRAFFSYSKRETHPTLDEKFFMGLDLAGKVLFRLVSAKNFSEQKGLEEFWLLTSSVGFCEGNARGALNGDCLSELKCIGMVRWGIRRQVRYLGRHRSDGNDDDGNHFNAQNSSSSFVNGIEEGQMKLGVSYKRVLGKEGRNEENDDDDDVINGEGKVKGEEDMEENEGEEEEDDDYGEDEEAEDEKNLKRKRYNSRNSCVKKKTKEKIEKKRGKQIQKASQAKRGKNRNRFKESQVLRNPKDRWSAERYKLAERNLLEVMKAKEATAEKPILRPQLRAEARKRIGDTGLLDHLLKHMAGKLAPGGIERFRRRHNADGAMEYWLESADLVNIRKDAGITDPYWVPPPGWKPGDSPTQDPICARELKLLKDDILKLKSDVELMATKMQLEEAVLKLRRELDELSSQRRQEDSQSITLISDGQSISQKLDQLAISLGSPKCRLDNASASMEKYQEQLMAISDFAKDVEKKIGKLLLPNEEERARVDSAFIVPTESTTEKEKKYQTMKPNNKQTEVQEIMMVGDERSELGQDQRAEVKIAAGSPAAEQKAAKIQRLKSGFRICKPQGTFLWPNMAKNNSINSTPDNMMSPQVLVKAEVPTPTSVSSSATSASLQLPYHLHHLQPSPPVKPLAERGAVTVSVSSVPRGTNYEDGSNAYSSAAMINLNNAQSNNNHAMPLPSPKADTNTWDGYVNGRGTVMGLGQKQLNTCCSSSASSLPNSEVGNWLALSTVKSTSDESSHG